VTPTASAAPRTQGPGAKPASASTPARLAPRTAPTAAPPAEVPTSAEQPLWKELVDRLQREKASRFFRLSYSRMLEVADGELRIGVTGRDAVTALTAPEIRADIEAAIEDQFGTKLRFAPVVLDESGAVPKMANLDIAAREDPVVKLSMELLDGKIEAVLPREDRGD
ncbi:MAG: hypothetical protein ABGY42_02165, partial [bacterium]